MRALSRRRGIRLPTIRSIWTPPNTSEEKRRSSGEPGDCAGIFQRDEPVDYLYGYAPNMGGGRRSCAPPAALEADDTEEAQEAGGAEPFPRCGTATTRSGRSTIWTSIMPGWRKALCWTTRTCRDYARKAAKASLDADIKYNRMRQGQGQRGRVGEGAGDL